MKALRKVWVWLTWTVGALLAACAGYFMLKSSHSAKKAAAARNKEEKARVELADVEAERNVAEAHRRGSFADRLRRDGAGR